VGALLAGCLLTGMTGCVGYRLGSMLPPDIKTVHVPSFVNETSEPLVDVECTRAVIENIQLDGSLKIAGEDFADTVLTVVVYGYDLKPVAFSKQRQRTRAEEYRLILTARVLLKRRMTGEVVVENPAVRGDATFEVLGNLPQSKRNALPRAADDLAHQIVKRVVEVW
jgi:hypothetical protein